MNMKVFDCFIFFNELDLLELRLNVLDSCVDYFVIVESAITFQGEDKEFFLKITEADLPDLKTKLFILK